MEIGNDKDSELIMASKKFGENVESGNDGKDQGIAEKKSRNQTGLDKESVSAWSGRKDERVTALETPAHKESMMEKRGKRDQSGGNQASDEGNEGKGRRSRKVESTDESSSKPADKKELRQESPVAKLEAPAASGRPSVKETAATTSDTKAAQQPTEKAQSREQPIASESAVTRRDAPAPTSLASDSQKFAQSVEAASPGGRKPESAPEPAKDARSTREQDASSRAEARQQSDAKDRFDIRQEPTGKVSTREGAEMRTSEQGGKPSDVSAVKPGDKDVGGKTPGRIDDVVLTQSLMPQEKGGRVPTDSHDKPRTPEGALGDAAAKLSRLVDIQTSHDSITFTLQTKDGQRKIDLADPKTQQSILDAAALKDQGDIRGLQTKHPVIAELLGTLKPDQLNQIKDTLTQAHDLGPRNKAIDAAVVQDLSVLADRIRSQMKDQPDQKSRGELGEKPDATKDAKLEGKKDIKSETDGKLSDNVKQAFTKLDNVIDKIKTALHSKEDAQEKINERQASHLDYMKNLVEKYGGVPSEIITPRSTVAEPGKLTDQHMDQIFDRLSKSTESSKVTKEEADESTSAKKDDEDTHTTCTTNQGDTIRTIARDRLADPNLAPLICKLNPGSCKIENIDNPFASGTSITLPNQSDIATYRKQLQDRSGSKA
jgi:hypothetical protein